MEEGEDDERDPLLLRPVCRQSSMDFIKPGPEDIRGNAAIARLVFFFFFLSSVADVDFFFLSNVVYLNDFNEPTDSWHISITLIRVPKARQPILALHLPITPSKSVVPPLLPSQAPSLLSSVHPLQARRRSTASAPLQPRACLVECGCADPSRPCRPCRCAAAPMGRWSIRELSVSSGRRRLLLRLRLCCRRFRRRRMRMGMRCVVD